MLRTKRPLEEKLTLFWHDQFATGQNKVRDYRMMLRQNLMFREHASGSFRDLLIRLLDLTDLDDGNMKMTTDFRRVYATLVKEWLGYADPGSILKGWFEPLGVFA